MQLYLKEKKKKKKKNKKSKKKKILKKKKKKKKTNMFGLVLCKEVSKFPNGNLTH